MRSGFIVPVLMLSLLAACDSSGPLPPTDEAIVEQNRQQELEEAALAAEEPLEPVFGAATGGPSEVGVWGPVLDWPHVAVSMAVLPDGDVLTYSGSERRTWPTTEQTYSAVWNPDTGSFLENLHQGHNMFCAAMSMTSDGKVLVNGGRNQGNSPWTTLFDYRNGEWQTVENMASGGRWYPTTLATGDGKVMTAMGASSNPRNPDLWDPDTGWGVLNGIDFITMRQRNNEFGRESVFPLLSLAPNGNIYHYWDTVENHMVSAQGNGEVRAANPTTDGVNHAGGVQLMYDIGKLISTGRNDGSWGGNATGATNSAFTIDLNGAVPDIRSTSNMGHNRKYHQLIPLPTGEVLVIGGNTTGAKFQDNGSVMEPEIWNPETGQWRGMANMAIPRDYHSTAMLLTDGRVVTAGGGYSAGNANSAGTHQDGQIFHPPYLYASDGSPAVRPVVSASQASVDAGEDIQVTTTGDIAYFSLIRMSATTHAINTDARFYKPEFAATGNNQYAVTVNQNPNISTPGYWMLFAVDSSGVPSEAQVIRITALDTRLDNLALQGTATQSSNYRADQFLADQAIDGDLSGSDEVGSITHTQSDAQAWWEVDLGRVVDIDMIRVWNRNDCCTDRLSDFHVMVSSQPFASDNLDFAVQQNGVLDFPTAGVAGRQTDIKVGAKGRYVRVQLSGTNFLHLAEVQVFGSKRTDISNLAVGGSASQSSTYQNASFAAGKAIDGDTYGGNDNQIQTVGGNGGSPFNLSCASDEALAGVYGSTGTYVNSIGPRCVSVSGTGDWIGFPRDAGRAGTNNGQAYSNTCPVGWAVTGFTGRADAYVNQVGLICRKLSSPTTVQGIERGLTASGADSGTQRGPYSCGDAAATGINGRSGSWLDQFGLECPVISDGVISHTNNDVNAWWELDLGRVVDIDSVVIWNRTDCCSERLSDFHLLVSDQPFVSKDLDNTLTQASVFNQVYAGAAGETTELVVGRTGRYVRVQLNSGNTPVPLHMAEVQVMGAELDAPLSVQPISTTPQQNGSAVTFTADATGSGQLEYKWNFGDGNLDTAYSANPTVSHNFANPGRYVVSLIARDATGEEIRSTFTQLIHANLTNNAPKSSRGMLEHSSRSQVWNVNPDNNTVSVVDTQSLSLLAEIAVGSEPVSVAEAPDGNVWVVNRQSASISVVDASSLAVVATYPLQRASQPYGILMDNAGAFVALQAVGKVQRVSLTGVSGASANVGANPRHMALNAAADKLYVSRYITDPLPGEESANVIVDDGTQKFGGEVIVLDAASLSPVTTIVMQHINRVASENEGPGIPNYLGPVVISPAGDTGWLPSKQDNILAGELRGGTGITFDQTVRAVTSKINLVTDKESLSARVDHDNASVAANSAFDPFGVTLFTSLEGNRQVSIIDVQSATEIGRFDTGRAPQSIVVSEDGKRLYVHNFMDRTVGIYDVEAITQNGASTATEMATVNVVSSETLTGNVLRGKQLFYDARDDRLASLDYMSCASCHVDGEHDGRTWDFTSLGEGLRNTITLKGRAGMGHGMLHWSSNFDEVQDFEGQIRDFAGGSGLMNDADFIVTEAPLGPSKAGLSNDLDSLAAYLTSLDKVDESPWKTNSGALTVDAQNGASLFVAKGCVSCHTGTTFTDSTTAQLHDVGTLMTESGQRLGGPLPGLDTPTLLGVWRTAPYLHDGSAATLEDAIAAHTSINMTAVEQADLASYLAQLDDGAPAVVIPPPPVGPPAAGSNGVSNPLGANVIALDGNLTEWSGIASFGIDADDTSGVNTIDWAEATMAHDDDNFYVAYRNHGPVAENWGYGMYIDVDGDSTTGFKGFSGELPIGADYLIEGRVVQQYTGTGTNWSWVEIGAAQYSNGGNAAELSVPRSLLGNPSTLRLYFNGNNAAVGGDVIDFYPDAVSDASQADTDRYLTYTIAATTGNTPPSAFGQNLRADQNTPISVVLAGNDLNDDELIYEVVDQPSNGTLTGVPPNVIYTPATGFLGVDQFSFTVSDLTATSAPADIVVTVVGQAPNNQAAITVDGSLSEWSNISSFGADPIDATGAGDVIDWLEGWVAHDADKFYLAYENKNPVTLSWGYGIYLDTDNSTSTGFRNFDGSYPIGVDYIFEANELLRYTGTGLNWSWVAVASGDLQISGNTAEVALQRSQLGNPSSLRLFYVGENAANNGPTVDYYPDGVVSTNAPLRFFSYDTADQSVNVAPTAIAQTLTMDSDTTRQITLSGNDANGDALTYQITRQPVNGTLGGIAANVQYVPDAGFSGADSFEFRVSDGTLSSVPAVVSISVTSNTTNPSGSNAVAALSIDGSLQDWSGLTPLAADAADVSGGANEIDWRQGYLAHSPTLLYMAYQNDVPITQLTYGHAAFIGTDDSDATGFKGFSSDLPFGADYLLEGTDLYKYAGSGNNWLWTYIATVNSEQVGSVAEFALSRAQLGNPAAVEIFWRGNNEAVTGTGVDFYPDAAGSISAPLAQRRFRYELQ